MGERPNPLDAVLRPLLRAGLRYGVKPALHPRVPYGAQRAWTALAARTSTLVPRGVRVTPGLGGGLAGERIAPWVADKAILYLHGGAFCVGSPRVQRPIAAHLALAANAVVYVPDYRLAPEHPYPAALDDALAAYALVCGAGHGAGRIVLAGDSAGAGLALALLVALRERGAPLPAAALLFSPWADLTLSGATMELNAAADPLLSRAWLAACAQHYCAGLPPADSRISPLFARLDGLPPLAIHVGTREILLDDASRLAVRARAAGVDVDYRRYAGLWHNAQLQAGLLTSASASFRDAAAFLDRRLGAGDAASA